MISTKKSQDFSLFLVGKTADDTDKNLCLKTNYIDQGLLE